MSYKVDFLWARTALVRERGGASVVVNNPNDAEEIRARLEELDFYEFLVTDREYDDVKWSFNSPSTGQDNDPSPDNPEHSSDDA